MFLPLSWLSIASVLGIVSSVLLIVVILIDGLTKVSIASRSFVNLQSLTGSQTTGPGSIWDPQPTNLGIASLPKLGVSFGLFMAGVRVRLLMSLFHSFSHGFCSSLVILEFLLLLET